VKGRNPLSEIIVVALMVTTLAISSNILCVSAKEDWADPPVLVSPGFTFRELSKDPMGESIYTLTPIFKWKKVPNADYYAIYIRDIVKNVVVFNSEEDYGPIYGNRENEYLTFKLPDEYKLGYSKYRWNMASHSQVGWSYERTDGGKKYSEHLYFTTYPKGIDVHSWSKGQIDWSKLKNKDFRFVYTKATHGVGVERDGWEENVKEAVEAGMLVGVFHFAMPVHNKAKEEAKWFAQCFNRVIKNYPKVKRNLLRPALDIEDYEYPRGKEWHLSDYLTKEELSKWIREWMETVKDLTGVEPILYTPSSYYRGGYASYLKKSVSQYDLWISDRRSNINSPDTGIWKTWGFWQYKCETYIEGVSRTVDLDVFNGSLSKLFALFTIPPELYAGTSNPGLVYRYLGGKAWQPISTKEELNNDFAVLCLAKYNGKLYAGTMSSPFPASGVGRVYRYDGGTSWTLVGDNLDNQVCSLIVYDGNLYAGTAWNGMRLYKYTPGSTNCGINDWTRVVDYPSWDGTRSLYIFHDLLLMGDIGYDRIGHWDGSNFYPDQTQTTGSCIYDFQYYMGKVYASAYMGRMWQSTDGIHWNLVPGFDYYEDNMWELETFKGLLYMAYNNGELRRSHGMTRGYLVYTAPDAIISMESDGSSLYFGTGGEAGALYGSKTDGIANVYRYDGTDGPILISDKDEFGGGVQVLYIPIVTVKCYNKDPVDLIVTDPDGLIISKEVNEIPGATYIEVDLNGDGDPDDQITIPYRKIGNYLITVVPEPDASPDETYTLEITINGQTIVLAEDVPISNIPDQPYLIQSTETEVNAAPVANADGPYTGFVGLPITFNATNSYDPDGKIVSYEWDLDGDGEFDDASGPNPTKTWDIPYRGNISLRVTDDRGLTSIDTTTVTVMKTIKIVNEPKYGSNDEWVTSKTTFNLTVIPTSTYVNKTYYRIWYKGSWTPWMEYKGNFTLKGECKHYLEYYSVDKAGNQERIHNQTHFVDDSPPVTKSRTGRPYYKDERGEWVTSKTSIQLSSMDFPDCGCGVKEIYYSYDNGKTWFKVNGNRTSFHIPEECAHVVKWYAVDNLGNEEEIHERILNVDNTPPETTLVIEGHYSGSGTPDDPYRIAITPETRIYLNATDKPECGAVGVRNTYFRIRADGLITKWMSLKELEEKGNDIKFAIPKSIIDKGGPFYLDYYSDDLLGNRESVKTAVFYLQKMHYHLGYKGFIWSFCHSRYRLL